MTPTTDGPIQLAAQVPEDGQRVLIWLPPWYGGYWRGTEYVSSAHAPGDYFVGYYGPRPAWWHPMPPDPAASQEGR